MWFPRFSRQHPRHCSPKGDRALHSLNLLTLLKQLPWLLLLTGAPAWAQASQSREMSNDESSVAVPAEVDAATTESNLFSEIEADRSNAPSPTSLDQPGPFTETLQAKASLDSPPSPELAATLCDGTAQSWSGQIIITSQTVCKSGLTPPSLWWTKEQVAQELRTSGKLVSDWSAQLKTPKTPGQVRLVVNPQMWSLMDYFERYDFVNSFGLAARNFGYQTEIYNTKGNQLASYICTARDSSESNDSSGLSSSCQMSLGSSLNLGYRGNRSKNLF